MYDQGLFSRGKAWLYSHRGTGVYGFPIRIGVRSEIAVLSLVPDGADRGGGW
jgi:predicted MPP superfamily phosphohydrolase